MGRVMKNIVWSAGSFAIMLTIALAQGRPDFTGTWVVETVERPPLPEGRGSGSRMGGGRRGMRPPEAPDGDRSGSMTLLQKGQRVRVKQSAERLIVTIPNESGEQMSAYALDGSESSNTSGRSTIKSKTTWEGAALVTEGTRRMEGPRGEVTLKTREVRSLGQDGRTMTVRTTLDTPRGKMTSTITFVKADE